MGLKDNFKQAAKELMDGPAAPQPQDHDQESPLPPEPAPVPLPESEIVPEYEYTPPNFTDSFPKEPEERVTVIAPGTVIRGSVESDCNVEVYGEVQGDILTTRDLKLKGKIQGNATGGNVELTGIHMVGDITATGIATMDAGSEVEGDVTAQSVILNGRIWGNVRVSDRLSLESSAVICGHVAAEKLSVNEGAVIQGEILIGKSVAPPKRERSAGGDRPKG